MNTQTPKRKIVTVNFAQQLVIHEIIGRHWKTTQPAADDEPAVGHYLDGHTDRSIADLAQKQLGVEVTENNVMGVRSQAYGVLFRKRERVTPDADRAKLEAEIEAHLKTVAELRTLVGQLENRCNGQVQTINDLRVSVFVIREMMQRNGVWSANTADLFKAKAMNELGLSPKNGQGSLLAKVG